MEFQIQNQAIYLLSLKSLLSLKHSCNISINDLYFDRTLPAAMLRILKAYRCYHEHCPVPTAAGATRSTF